MVYIDFISKLHKKTKRNYLERMTNDKPEIIEVSKNTILSIGMGSENTTMAAFGMMVDGG